MLSFIRKAALFLPRRRAVEQAGLCAAAILLAGFAVNIGGSAFAVDLSGNPYIKRAPYQPPPLPPSINSPSAGRAGDSGGRPYNPPMVEFRPERGLNPSRAVNHDQWCRQNHPSYRATDNTYRPFDKAGTMPPQARVPCVSPY